MTRPQLHLVHTTGHAAPFLPGTGNRRFWAVPVFRVSITRADGTVSDYTRRGGSSCDHPAEAMDAAGLGGVIRVLVVTAPEAA